MSATGSLEAQLDSGSWSAVDVARAQGPSSLAVLRRYAHHENPHLRQIAVAAAGAVGAPEAAELLAEALSDPSINVRISAAAALSKRAYPGATDAVLAQLATSPDEPVRESLALAAGRLPGPRTLETLKPLAEGRSGLARNARLALVKLVEPGARAEYLATFAAPTPTARYEALVALAYVNDPALLEHATRLLSDRADALAIGTVHDVKYRRVCDAAVDALAAAGAVRVSFPVNPERIYSDEELRQVSAAATTR